MTVEKWDAVVIGSGLGGLCTAACLGSAGKKVLVLEAHDVAGGNSQVFRRHHGDDWFEFDVGVHYVGELGPGGILHDIYASLGVGDRMRARELDPDGFDTLVFPDFEFRVPASWDEYRSRLIDQFPNDRAGIEKAVDVLRTVAAEGRMVFGGDRPTFDEWAYRPLAQLFEEAELSQPACAVLDHWSTLYAGPPSESSVVMHARIADHYMNGAYYPEGGGQMFAARLIQVIEACGGEVRTLSPVRSVVVESGSARGVELEDGTRIDAPAVVANCDYRRLMTQLIDAEHLAPGTRAWAEEARMTLGLVCVYVVVSKELVGPNTNYFVLPDYRTDEMYAELDEGKVSDGDLMVYVALASRKDPGNAELCPPGHTNFQIMTLAPRGYDYWGVDTGPADGGRYRRDHVYRQRKQEITDRMVDAAEKVLGPFRDEIVHLETATTLTHERYIRSSEGTSYGYMHSPEQSGLNRPQLKTEIDGLWIVGANATTGHGVAGALTGGVFCAGEILDRPLIAEIALGEQLVDPGDIPADPEHFDPLEYSRGARLRAKRADRAESQRRRRVGAR
jgi:phytoene dehydrogenase-like protein